MPCVGAVVSQEMIAPAVMAAVPGVFTDARPLGISESVGRRFFFLCHFFDLPVRVFFSLPSTFLFLSAPPSAEL